MASTVPVEIATQASEELLAACHRLIPQLSSSAAPITVNELAEIVNGESTIMFVARVDNQIVGLLTLAVFRIPTAVRAWIEDVVVDGLGVEMHVGHLEGQTGTGGGAAHRLADAPAALLRQEILLLQFHGMCSVRAD